jgi:hypothetical protein
MLLTYDQRRQFRDEGYLTLRQAVARPLIDRALRLINHSIGEGIDINTIAVQRATTYCADLTEHPALLDLVNASSVLPQVEALVGRGKVQPIRRAQIALRFPAAEGVEAKSPRGHLDGYGTDTNGIPKGRFSRSFSALAVVLLSDLPQGDSGNFTVWPGSHVTTADFFAQHGVGATYDSFPDIPKPRGPVACTGLAGDVVIAHHALFHAAGRHVGPHVRYATIYRVRHVDVEANGCECLTDLWREWDGIRDLDEQPVTL